MCSDERYFSCPLYAYYVVQAPWLFTLLKSLLRPFVSSEPLEKIVVHSSHFVEHMTRCIDIGHIPHHMGGHCQCGRGGGAECLKPFDEERLLAPCNTSSSVAALAGDAPLIVEPMADAPLAFEELNL